MSHPSVFWADLARDLEGAEFLEAYAAASLEMAQDARVSAEEPGPDASGSSQCLSRRRPKG